LPIDQKRHSMLRPSSPFSILSQPSLPQPGTRASSTPSLRIDDFVGLQTIFQSMNHQVAEQVEWSPLDQKRHSMLMSSSAFSILPRPSLPRPGTGASFTPLLRIDDFLGFQTILLSI
jgi:hypothetical protein